MRESDFLLACLPLFEAGEVEVLEWSFDIGWQAAGIPDWGLALLSDFETAGRLIGHGVTFSPLSAGCIERQEAWLEQFRCECELRNYQHISEHFGFMSAGDFHRGPPLPVPLTGSSLALGQERLQQLAEIANRPIGLENLALAFGRDDVARQGEFLDALLAPVDGFLLLDLHNVYCQACNFGLDAKELLDLYPLQRVKEMHISGGSWIDDIRRDTHDDSVPDIVFDLLQEALLRCPQTEIVILERLGGSFGASCPQHVADFARMKEIAHAQG